MSKREQVEIRLRSRFREHMQQVVFDAFPWEEFAQSLVDAVDRENEREKSNV